MMPISYAKCKPTIETEKNYLLVKCDLCTKGMILTEGSIIFGNKWYHNDCFANLTSKQVFAKEQKIQYGMKNNWAD